MKLDSTWVPCSFCGRTFNEGCMDSRGLTRWGYVHRARAKVAAKVLGMMKQMQVDFREA